MDEVRIDKWMWAVRLFKTRSLAAEACKKGRISMGGNNVKPSRTVRVGDVIEVRKPPVTFSFRVLDLTESRMGAPLVPRFMENVTPPEQYEILEMNRISGFVDRARGLGRLGLTSPLWSGAGHASPIRKRKGDHPRSGSHLFSCRLFVSVDHDPPDHGFPFSSCAPPPASPSDRSCADPAHARCRRCKPARRG